MRQLVRNILAELTDAAAKEAAGGGPRLLFPDGIQSLRLTVRTDAGIISDLEVDGAGLGARAAAFESSPAEEDFHEDPDLIGELEGMSLEAVHLEAPAAAEPSGRQWVARFPGSRSTADLGVDFKQSVEAFLAALAAAGAAVRISATYRPPERAYLMHHAFNIAKGLEDPQRVDAMPGVNIAWAHKDANGRVDLAASRRGAKEMVEAYGMVHRAALRSHHTERRAIDMSITWAGTLNIKKANGQTVALGAPRNGKENGALHAVGGTYGVIKLVSDPPHWSDDGH